VVDGRENDWKWEMVLLNLFEGTEKSMELLFTSAAHLDDVMRNHLALNLKVPGFKPQSENCQRYGRLPYLRCDVCLVIFQGWDLVK
jgi:hypothetical protein